MKSQFKILLSAFLLSFSFALVGQEICDNAIDDDGDGLVDLLDDECTCIAEVYDEVIGDFEVMSCCPDGYGDFDCVDDGWVTVNGTPDYYHTCDFLGNGDLMITMPLPSGNGAMGGIGGEHFGICLDYLTIPGNTYDVEMWYHTIGSVIGGVMCENAEMAIYGTNDCDNLSPMDPVCVSPGWYKLTSFTFTGSTDWQLISFPFVAGQSTAAFAIGFDCDGNAPPCSVVPRFFIDDIHINGDFAGQPEPPELVLDGNCVDGMTLEAIDVDAISHQWYKDGIAIVGATSNPFLIDPLEDGFYQVLVDYPVGCSISDSIEVVVDKEVLTLDEDVVDVSCYEAMDGSIDITINSPNAPFIISWSNGATSEDIDMLGPGTYTVTVTDANGCYITKTYMITEPPPLSAGAIITQPIATNPLGQAQIQAAGGTPMYDFLWEDGTDVTIKSDLEPGVYMVTVTDDNDCEVIVEFEIYEPLEVEIEYTNESCAGSCDGTATLLVTGGLLDYTVTWSNDEVGESIDGLCAGMFFFTVTDDFGTVLTGFVTIETEVEISVSANYDASLCLGETSSILASASNGSFPYTFEWDNGEIGEQIFELESGSYTVTVTDDNGCTISDTYIIESLPEINITGVTTDTPCGLSEGAININVTGGTPGYSYMWDSGQTSEDISDIAAGTYTIVVTDFENCTASESFSINNISDLAATAEVVDVNCIGDDTGSIDITIMGGTTPYTIEWSTSSEEEDIENLPAGDYSVTITDAGGCLITYEYELIELSSLEIESTITDVDCFSGLTGSIEIAITEGSAPHTFYWNGEVGDENIRNVSAGIYDLEIVDDFGCSYSFNYEIVENDTFEVTAGIVDNDCFQGADGNISVDVVEGNTGYSFVWESGELSSSITNLTAGIYTVEVTNPLGCPQSYSYEVADGIEIIVDEEISNENCFGLGSISLTSSGGNGQFSYVWDDLSEGNFIENLTAGNYQVTVSDILGCTAEENYEIEGFTPLTITEEDVSNASCFEASDGAINITVTGGDAPYDFDWSPSASGNPLGGLSAGEYTVTITDKNGCSIMGSYTVTQPIEILGEISILDPICFEGLGSLEFVPMDPSLEYTYEWSTGPLTQSITESAGNYSVVVTDAFGCEKEFSAVINEPSQLEITLLSSQAPTPIGNDGRAEIMITGGTPTYTTSWSGGQSSLMVNDLTFGQHFVIVTDMNGCTDTLSITLEMEPLSFIVFSGNNPCFDDCKGNIELMIDGGLLPYTVQWSNGLTGTIIEDLCGGFYTATITDGAGNQVITEPIEITNPTDITIDGQTYDISCVEMEDGSIEVTASGGAMPYVFTWDNNMTGNLLEQLPVGVYIVTATDENGCDESSMFSLDDIPLISLDASSSNIDCDNDFGTISVIGNNEYDYPILLNGNSTELNTQGEIPFLTPGDYNVSYEINENCIISIDELSISDLTAYEIELNVQSVSVKEGESFELVLSLITNLDLTGYEIIWNAQNEFECTEFDENGECTKITVLAVDDEVITVRLEDDEGCFRELEIVLNVKRNYDVHVPNIFNPKSTTGNNVFEIFLPKWIDQIDKFFIYDRWGNKVYTQEGISKSTISWWDGTYMGENAMEGVYTYYIELTIPDQGPQSYVGDVTIIR